MAACLVSNVVPSEAHAAADSALRLPTGIQLEVPSQLTVVTESGSGAGTVVTLRNPTAKAVAAIATLSPVADVDPPDRSFAAWIYSYRHEQILDGDDVAIAEEGTTYNVSALASRSRFNLRAIAVDGVPVAYRGGSYQLAVSVVPGADRTFTLYSGETLAADVQGSPVEAFLYWTLWSPFRALCFGLERLAQWLLPLLGPFLLLLVLVALVRALTFPINRWSFRKQREFDTLSQTIAPEVANIKATLRGGDQSEAIFSLYQSNGLHPLAGLKGSVGLFVQIPILIAVFNVASDSALFQGVDMGWIADVSQPERTFSWGLDVPVLGRFFNLIAACLALFMIWSELSKPQRSSGTLLFAVCVGVLLYSFPALLVVYWFLITIAQWVEQRLAW